MFINKLLVYFIVLCFAHIGSFKKIPDYIHVCKRDPNTINECVKNAIESLRPQLKSGIPELDVPGIEPFIIPEVKVVDGNSIPVNALGKNIKVTGASNFTIKSLSVDLSVPDAMTVRARVRIPKLHFNGLYKINARILVLTINGEGTLVADAVKCEADLVLKSTVITKNGIRSLKFNTLDVDINVKDYRIKLEGLFNGDKTLGQATNQAINENRDEFFKATKPYLETTVSKTILEIANKAVDGLPYDGVLPLP